jgi:thiamine-monophosphate kinase
MTLFEANPAAWDESSAIEAIRQGVGVWEPGAEDACLLGAGPDEQVVITSDQINERQAFPGEDVRSLVRRGVNEAVSDIAAAGATLYGVQIDVRAPDNFDLADFEAIGQGVADVLLNNGGLLLQASNMSRGEFGISTTAVGLVPRGTAMRRSTAKPGDVLFVSGPVGGWDAALAILNSGIADELDSTEWDILCKSFLDYRAELPVGVLLRQIGSVTSCIDANDCLPKSCKDLASSSGVGLAIDSSSIPLADTALVAGRYLDTNPAEFALNGIAGDDRLLFTIASSGLESTLGMLAMSGIYPSRLGEVTDDVGRVEFSGGSELAKSVGKRPTSIYGSGFSSSRPLVLKEFPPAGRRLGTTPGLFEDGADEQSVTS